jgi:phosphatidylglycerol:prolipoprotein diacylglycerol transferase
LTRATAPGPNPALRHNRSRSRAPVVNRALDGVVRSVHRAAFFRWYHPYFAANDAGKVAVIACGLVAVRALPDVTGGQFVTIVIATMLLYRGFTEIKGRVFGIWSRSYLQDLAFCIVPSYCAVSVLAGVPVWTALDLMGLLLPLYIAFIRVGCFLGACCFGVPSRWGVKYDGGMFTRVRALRNFSPGVDPRTRVLPTQLIESLFNLVIFLFFFRWFLTTGSRPPGGIFLLYVALYSVMRFGLDFFRVASSRPRVGPLSEAQVFAAGFAAASLLVLMLRFG